MPVDFFGTVKRFQELLEAAGGFVFAAPDARDGIMDRHLFDKWLSVAVVSPNWTRQFGKRRLAFQLRIVRWKHNAGVRMDGGSSAPSLSVTRSLAFCGRSRRSQS